MSEQPSKPVSGFKEGYIPSKKSELDHQTTNILFFAVLREFDQQTAEDRQEQKEKFIKLLQAAKSLPNYGAVTEEVLLKIIEKAKQTDWNNRQKLQDLKKFIDTVKQSKH